jgi:hypothetical protein
MVIRTEYSGTRYSMGSSDPLPAGFEIRFGGLNFQATGNDYLMRLTNREELRARRQAGSVPAATAHAITTQTPAGTDAAGPSAPRRRRRSGQRSFEWCIVLSVCLFACFVCLCRWLMRVE